MKCLKCSAEIPDTSSFCPLCGEVITKHEQSSEAGVVEGNTTTEQVIPTAAATAGTVLQDAPASTIPAASDSSSGDSGSSSASSEKKESAFSGLGSFFKSYFKNPIQAVIDHSSSKYWVLGLCVPLAYALVQYIFMLTSISFISFGSVMSQLFSRTGYSLSTIIRFATLIFAYFLLQKLFKLEKQKSLKEVIAVTGLAFWPIIPGYIVINLFMRLDFLRGFGSGIELAVYAIAALILFEEMKRFNKDDKMVKSFLCIVISFATMPVIEHFNDMIVSAISNLFNLF